MTQKTNPWTFDVRVRERNLRAGSLTEKELDKYIGALPDLADQAEPFGTPQPALAQPEEPEYDDEDEEDDEDEVVMAAAPTPPTPPPPAAEPAPAAAQDAPDAPGADDDSSDLGSAG